MSVAVVLKGYPRLSETFIAQEIQSLQKAGLDLELISLRHPTDTAVHPVHREINKTVLYLPEYLWQESTRVIRAWWRIRKSPHYSRARRVWLNDLKRDLTPNRIRRFGQSLVLANELSDGVTLIYAHFLHTPSSVARYAALLRNLPWSFSAHAKDIWTTPEWEKREKITDCAWGVTCTTMVSIFAASRNRHHVIKKAMMEHLAIKLFDSLVSGEQFPKKDSLSCSTHSPLSPKIFTGIGSTSVAAVT